jgi:hypothetical protein
MRKSVLAVVGVAIAVIVIGYIVSHRNPPSTSGGEHASGTNPGAQASYSTNTRPTPPTPKPHPTNPPPTPPIIPQTNPVTPQNANLITNWEERLDNILISEKPDPDKAKEMSEMFPFLTAEAQEEMAHHISNLTPDENYASISKFLTNSTLPEAVLDVFTEDVLNRPNAIKLPLLLDIARDSQHPKAAEAKDILELFLEEDFGTNWPQWQAKLDQWLKDNPD